MPTEIGAIALGFLATSHFWKFRALFFDGRIPARFLWLLMGLSMVWNAIVCNSGEGLRSIVIMRDAAILFAFWILLYRSLGIAYAKYLAILASFFLFQGESPIFLLFCLASFFCFVIADVLYFNLRILFSKGPFFSIVPRHVLSEIRRIKSAFQIRKALQYAAVFCSLLFFIRAAQTFLFSVMPLETLFADPSSAMSVSVLMLLVSWWFFSFGKRIFTNPKASVTFVFLSLVAMGVWHSVAPVSLASTARLFFLGFAPLALIFIIRRFFQFYADVMGSQLVHYERLKVGETVDFQHLFAVWYDYQPWNDRIMKVLESLENPIDAKSKKKIAHFFRTCLKEVSTKRLQGFSPRFEVRTVRPISLIPIIVPAFFAFFAYSVLSP